MRELFSLAGAPNTIPMFVYGTLRPGGALHDSWIADAVIDSEPATATGYALRNAGPFPLMVPTGGEVVYGDILWVDRTNRQVMDTIYMELQTGYDMEVVEVEGDGVNIPIPALAFVWNNGTAGLPRVPQNDWIAT